MGSDWAWGYLAGKRKARRRYQRDMAALESRIRAEMGLPATAPASTMQVVRPRRHRPHIGRWVVLAVVLLVLCLLVAFVAYLVVFGLQHGYIYPARHG